MPLTPEQEAELGETHILSPGADVFGRGMLPDGTLAPALWVVYECPQHHGRFELDAYKGPPRCRQCPSRPLLEPRHLGEEHTAHYRNPHAKYGNRGRNEM